MIKRTRSAKIILSTLSSGSLGYFSRLVSPSSCDSVSKSFPFSSSEFEVKDPENHFSERKRRHRLCHSMKKVENGKKQNDIDPLLTSKNFLETRGHFPLLLECTVVFNRKYHRIFGRYKRMIPNSSNDIHEFDLCGQSVSVINKRHSVRSIPAIQFNTPATHPQTPSICISCGFRFQLVTSQICIVR